MTEPYDIAMGPVPPPLPGTVVLRDSPEQLIDAMAADLFFQAMACVRTFGDFHLALTGSTLADPLYRRLMYDPPLRGLPWKKTHLWIVSDRRLPSSDPQSQTRRVCDWLVEHSDIPREQVHELNADAADAAERYEKALQESLEWREKGHDRLDFVLLAPDGSAPSIALDPPSTPQRLVASTTDSVAMTDTLINGARCVAVLLTGAARRPLVDRLAAGTADPIDQPLAALRPVGGELRWYIDWAACHDTARATRDEAPADRNGST